MLINEVAPQLTALGIEKQNPELIERAIELLEKLFAKNNKITRFWKSMDLNITNAAQSQGSIEW